MPEKLVAVMGDRQAARMPLEQRDAEIGLQLLDGLGDRGLRDAERLRSAAHRALFGDGDEILELTQREGHGGVMAWEGRDWQVRPDRLNYRPDLITPIVLLTLPKNSDPGANHHNRRIACSSS
jgi:hypothetical protein